MSDKINTAIIGAAAEHYVMYRLLLSGMIASLAPKGVPYADIIVSDAKIKTSAAIQVKARRVSKDGGWHMQERHEGLVQDRFFYCFVDFERSPIKPDCWTIPSKIVSNALAKSHRAWLETPGRNGRPHQDTKMRRLLPDYDLLPQYRRGWLDQYFEKWEYISGPIAQFNLNSIPKPST